MPTEQVTVIEGDGSSDTVTVTDDPVEDATVQAVRQAIGDETTASEQADSTVAATLLERVTALVDVLTSGQADDEVRVALAADLLTGNLDVNLNAQSGNVEVDLAADSLAGSLDVDLAEVSHGTVETTDDGNFVVSDIPATASEGSALPGTAVVVAGDDGTDTHLLQLRGDDLKVSVENDQIDLPTETTLSAVKAAVEAIDDALGSNATDTLRVSSPSDLDVNLNTDSLASALDVDLAGQSAAPIKVELSSDALAGNLDVDLAAASAEPFDVSAATVTVQEDTPLDVSAAEVDVDLASQTGPALDVSGATVAVQEASSLDVSAATVDVQEATALDVSASTVPVEQQTPIQVEDSGGTAIDPATEGKLENVRSLLDDLDDALASVAGDTLRTEQQTPVGIEDPQGTQIEPATQGKLESVRELLDKLEDALTSVGSDELRATIENGASPVAFPDTGRRTVSTAGSPESLVSAPAPVASGVEIKAMPGNTGTAFIFISGESKADSYPLAPGDEVFMPVDDASKVIVDVDTGGDTVAFIAA